MQTEAEGQPSIMFGVTTALSLTLLGGVPEHMATRGWTVHVASAGGTIWGQRLDRGVIHHKIPMKRDPSLFFDLAAGVRWLSTLARTRPNMVSIGTPKAAFLGLLAAQRIGIPIRVYMLRGLRLEGSRGIKRFILSKVEGITSQTATHILAVSESLADSYANCFPSQASKITVLGKGSSHGVDCRLFRPRDKLDRAERDEFEAHSGQPRTYKLGFVGRFCVDKGANTVLAAKRFLFSKGIDAEFVIVGKVEGAKSVISKMNSFGRPVREIGAVEQTAPYYNSFDLLLLPSLREGMPNCVLEASASGVPTVATAATGTSDAIQHMKTGVLTPLGDDDAFCRAVETLLLDSRTRKNMGKEARAWVTEHFESQAVEESHACYYEGLIESAGVRSRASL